MDILTLDNIDFSEYERETDPQQKVRSLAMYAEEIAEELTPHNPTAPKYPRMPFANFWLYFAPGEVTVWAGFNGSGKSMLQGQVLATLAEQGVKSCIASAEMRPRKTGSRIIRQMTGKTWPKREDVDAFLARTDQTLYVYDQQGDIDAKRLRAVIWYCADKLGIQHFAVDSLMKCVSDTDNYNGQKNFVNMLTVLARDLNIHIHLVVHMNKGEGDEKIPTRINISGAGSISDLADNVLIIWRNKKKERDRLDGKEIKDSDADALLICDKSRNGDWEGRIPLWFDDSCKRFADYNLSRRGLARSL